MDWIVYCAVIHRIIDLPGLEQISWVVNGPSKLDEEIFLCVVEPPMHHRLDTAGKLDKHNAFWSDGEVDYPGHIVT